MSQNITDFFITIDDIDETSPNNPPNLNSPYTTPLRRSPRNHGNCKKQYTLPKRKRKPQDPKRLKKENLTFKQVWTMGRPWLEHQVIDDKNFMFCIICKKANINNSI